MNFRRWYVVGANLARYFHTIRFLKTKQIYRRIWFQLPHRRPKGVVGVAFREKSGVWVRPPFKNPSLLLEDEFLFLGQRGRLDEIGWDGPTRNKLWRYNQHYFDDLNAPQAFQRREWHADLFRSWLSNNPPGIGTGWEPYPTSLRIVNALKWQLSGATFPEGLLESLGTQAEFLSKRLEYHLLGNHLFANAKALIFAGVCLTGSRSDAWLKRGLEIVREQLPEQVLTDGGNFERSTMYHALFLEDLLDLLNVSRAFPSLIPDTDLRTWSTTASAMLSWLEGMSHPDGEFGLFNDAAFGVAPALEQLAGYSFDLGVPRSFGVRCRDKGALGVQHWRESGYLRLEAPSAVALLDVAPVGPDYLPGHAHADTLSFELSLFGQRAIVNGGTSRYGEDLPRLRERQTCSHSTVEVDGESSSEVWSGFRVARRAYPFALCVEEKPDAIQVGCSHDGYKRLPGRPVHRRRWTLTTNTLTIEDRVTGRHGFAIARYILHPNVGVTSRSKDRLVLSMVEGERVELDILDGKAHCEMASFSPRFGESVDTCCIAVRLSGGVARVRLIWN